ncbi:single-stranded DNA-binding protein [Streptococcus ovuberis]|uniref:Single-stranded DNA-binding protein n=1 Tax=Streptococcus ovuberis TaxID=1936207 RepID=A0A7X6MWJ9_9STRE|nr:single-stranded DNA-binding protein [Streptococcus ovuberis]NKZ19707.1 single-stranded DNA-binding protein [Streptococcus ovuberis]
MNTTNLIGRLTKKAELYQTPNQKTYARFTIAVNRKKKSGGSNQEADFISCVIWGKSAENLVAWTNKGSLISVEGEIRTRTYEKDGHRQYVTEVWANYFQTLEKKVPSQEQVVHQEQTGFFKGQSTQLQDDYLPDMPFNFSGDE